MANPLFRAGLTLLSIGLSLLLSACGNSDLTDRVDRLEAELRGIRSDTRDEVASLAERVESAESSMGISPGGRSLQERIADLESSLSEALSQSGAGQSTVYLRPNLQGHAPISTDHGTFLVRLEGMDINLKQGGYTIHLNIGNPHAIAVEQFSLIGDFGGGTPELGEDEDYSLANPKLQAWQESLTPFETRVSRTLEPFSWTPFDIDLPAESRDRLELIRFTLNIESARIRDQESEGSGGSAFSHIRVDSENATVLKTEYGSFLVSVKKAEQTDLGTKLTLEIGNPYGFTLNDCRLIGDHGPALPRRTENESSADFNTRMRDWSASLRPFEAAFSSKISDFRWNRTTLIIPGNVDQVQFLRCQLRIVDVTLPAATDKR